VTNRFDRGSLEDLIAWSDSNCRAAEPEEGIGLYEGRAGSVPLELEDPAVFELRPEDRVSRCLAMTEAARSADDRVASVRSAVWHDGWGELFYASTTGSAAWDRGTSAGCGLSVVLRDGEAIEMGGFGDEGRRLANLDPEAIALEAVQRTALVLGGTPLKTDRYDLLLDPAVAAALLDEVGELFCASNVHRGRSLMAGRLGAVVASSLLTLEDDGRLPGRVGTSPFDGEGVPTGRTSLIVGGQAQAYLYNLQYARKDKVPPTGNACRGLSSIPDVATTNLICSPGDVSGEGLREKIRRGFYVTELMGLHTIDTTSGDFSLGAKGARIDRGELAGPVAGVTIAGNLLDLLRSLSAVGSDLRFFQDVAAPSLVMADVAVGGE
jgi:PmbA protein